MDQLIGTAENRTLGAIVIANSASITAQFLVSVAAFCDTYFVAANDVELLRIFSLTLSFQILGQAFLGGMLQSYLIVGGQALGSGDMNGFGRATSGAFVLALVGSIIVQGVVFAGLCFYGAFMAADVRVLALVCLSLTPGAVLSTIVQVARLRMLSNEKFGAFVQSAAILLFLKGIFLGIIARQFNFSGTSILIYVGLSSAASWGAILLILLILDSSLRITMTRTFWQVESLKAARGLFSIGLQIAVIILLELGVLGGSQLLVWSYASGYGSMFALVVQFIMLIETVAVAAGQVATVFASLAMGARNHIRVKRVIIYSVLVSVSVHLVMATIILVYRVNIADFLLASSKTTPLNLVSRLELYLCYSAACQGLLGIIICLAALLRGLGDLSNPLKLIAINYCGIGLCTAAILLYYTPLGDQGVWIGILTSLVSSIIALALRVNRVVFNLEASA